MTKKKVYIIVFLATLIVLVLYFYRFHEGLSDSQSDWGNFASFITGLITPILAFLNILVFIDLTRSIEKNRQRSEQEKIENEKKRHNQELQHQKDLILFQLRVDEINRLDKTIGDALTPSEIRYKDNIPHPVIYALTYVNSFLVTKIQLFHFSSKKQQEEFEKHFIKLKKVLEKYCIKLKDPQSVIIIDDIQGLIDERFDIVRNLFAITLNKDIKWLDQ